MMNMEETYRHKQMFTYGSSQFCGHIEDYFEIYTKSAF
jgi:hypothetical protein